MWYEQACWTSLQSNRNLRGPHVAQQQLLLISAAGLRPTSAANPPVHGRPHMGANGVSWPRRKMDEQLKKRKRQRRAVFYVCRILRAIRAGRCSTALRWPHIYSDMLQNILHFVPAPVAATAVDRWSRWMDGQTDGRTNRFITLTGYYVYRVISINQ